MHGYFGVIKVSEITEAELESYWHYRRDYYITGAGKELINHLRDGTLDEKAYAFALKNIATKK